MRAHVAPAPPARAPARTAGAACAPSAQLSPTLSGRACATEFQNASAVWPESVRPLASVIVPEIITGSRMPELRRTAPRCAKSAALALSVSKMVSTRSRSAPPSTRPRARLGVGGHELVEGRRSGSRGRSRPARARRSGWSGRARRPRSAARRAPGAPIRPRRRGPAGPRRGSARRPAPPCRSPPATSRST